MAVVFIPGAVAQIVAQVFDEACIDGGVYEAPCRVGAPCSRVQETLGASVICFAEAIRALQRNGDRDDFDIASQPFFYGLHGGIAAGFYRDHFRSVFVEPRPVEGVGITGKNENLTASDAPHFRQAGREVWPLVDGERGHTCVERTIREREGLSGCVDSLSKMSWALRSHGSGRLDCSYLSI